MMLSMMASFAEMERNLISERTKAGLQHRKKNKQAYTHTPYGYDRVGKNLLPNEQEQANIGVMQQLRANGISYRGICSYLSEEGIFTKTGKPKWTPATVRNVLNNDLHSLWSVIDWRFYCSRIPAAASPRNILSLYRSTQPTQTPQSSHREQGRYTGRARGYIRAFSDYIGNTDRQKMIIPDYCWW